MVLGLSIYIEGGSTQVPRLRRSTFLPYFRAYSEAATPLHHMQQKRLMYKVVYSKLSHIVNQNKTAEYCPAVFYHMENWMLVSNLSYPREHTLHITQDNLEH